MSTIKTTIESGVGFYSPKHHPTMDEHAVMEFISTFCVNQELFQDIKNEIKKIFKQSILSFMHKPNKRWLSAKLLVNDAHRVMTVEVTSNRYITRRGSSAVWENSYTVGYVYLALTEDGLIKDILAERPNMNPGVARRVAATFH